MFVNDSHAKKAQSSINDTEGGIIMLVSDVQIKTLVQIDVMECEMIIFVSDMQLQKARLLIDWC